MNAWFGLLDAEADGMDGSLMVTAWNDEVMFVVKDKQGENVAQFWIGADQAFAVQSVFRHVFGSEEAE